MTLLPNEGWYPLKSLIFGIFEQTQCQMVTITHRNPVRIVRLSSFKKKWLLFMISWFFAEKKAIFGHFCIHTYLGHFLTEFHFSKNNLIVDCIVHSLIDFHKEILKNKVRALSRNMHVPHMWLQIAPLSKCWMPLLTWDVYYTGPHVYLAVDVEDDQDRRQEGIWNGWTASQWVWQWLS